MQNSRRRLLGGLLCAVLASACTDEQPEFDVLILNGTVYDGSLDAARVTNIAITGDRIMSMNASANTRARSVINASGKMVTPGFIDPHTHARPFLLDPASNASLN